MKRMDSEFLEFGGEDDHVHLLVACHPKTDVSNLDGKLKGKSSYVLRQEFEPQIDYGDYSPRLVQIRTTWPSLFPLLTYFIKN